MTIAVTSAYALPARRRRGLGLVDRVTKKVTRCHDEAQVDNLTYRLLSVDQPTILAFINQHAVHLCDQSAHFANTLLDADVLLRDGVGMKALYWLRGRRAGINLNGTDFIPHLLQAAGDCRLALFGTTAPWVQRAALQLRALSPAREIDVVDGFQDVETYVALARSSKPRIIVLGMGMPKQEVVAQRLRASLDHGCLIVCGGAVLDFLAARFPRAPKLLRRLGLEWLFRLGCEPGRLWRRYTVGAFRFAGAAFGLGRSASGRGLHEGLSSA